MRVRVRVKVGCEGRVRDWLDSLTVKDEAMSLHTRDEIETKREMVGWG